MTMDNNCEDERWASHRREHALMQQALILAREDVNRRLEGMNELRAQITSERGMYITRSEYEAKHEALIQQVQSVERAQITRTDTNLARIVAIETQNAALSSRLAVYAALVGFAVSAAVVIVVKFVNI